MGTFSDYFTAEERGLPHARPLPVEPLAQPRGNAMFPIPHVAEFGGLTNMAHRTYRPESDAALMHSRTNARLMRNDPVIDACMRLRVYPTALLPFHVVPDDRQNPEEAEAAANAERLLAATPGLVYTNKWLLEAIFTGKSASKIRWQWVNKRGKNWMLPTAFEPVNGDKLVYQWDGTVGIRVGNMFSGPTISDGWSRVYMLSPEERECLVVHNFEPGDADYWLPQMAGRVNGVGLRDALYNLWALKVKIWKLGIDFLQWFAQGLTVYYFESGNAEHETAVRNWVEAQAGRTALLFPRTKDGGPNFKPIERFEASTASPQFIQQLVTDYFDERIRQIILGQSLTSTAEATGLGSGVAAAHQTTADIRVKYDSVGLDETRTRDILVPFYAANYPGMQPGRWVSDIDNPAAQSMLEGAQSIYQMGGRVPEEALLEAIGLPEIKPGDTILTNVQPMQPSAVGPLPEGVPVVDGQPVKMSKRQFATMCKLARAGNKRVWDYAYRNRSRFVVSSLWQPAV